jgi:acetyltransferase
MAIDVGHTTIAGASTVLLERAGAEEHAGPGTAYPGHLIETQRLADGTPVVIRPIAAHDRRRHWRFVCSLSLQTRYHRLMSARCLLPGELRRMVEIDYQREMALVATTADGESEVGVARYVRSDAGDGDEYSAEFAIVVADAWQRRGLGKQLLRSLRNAAASSGISRLGGITLATNTPMIRLARRLGFEISTEPGDWTVKRVTWSAGLGKEPARQKEGPAPGRDGGPNEAPMRRCG